MNPFTWELNTLEWLGVFWLVENIVSSLVDIVRLMRRRRWSYRPGARRTSKSVERAFQKAVGQ